MAQVMAPDGFVRPQKIAIVTSDLLGPIKNGGVGTACFALAETLARVGHEVTICFVDCYGGGTEDFDSWRQFYYSRNIRLLAVTEPSLRIETFGYRGGSYKAYQFLKETQPRYGWEIIHFPDLHGLGYYSLQAKKLGVAFQDTPLCVTLHGPSEWHHEFSSEPPLNPQILERYFLERAGIENSEILLAPSNSIVDWALKKGWKLPAQIRVIPNLLSSETNNVYKGRHSDFDCVAFFGRLETRKGLELFLEALAEVNPQLLHGRKIFFIGKEDLTQFGPARSLIVDRMAKLALDYRIYSGFGHQEALDFLRSQNPLVVIPSLAETMGYCLFESVECQLPVIASRIPAFVEYLDSNSQEALLFEAHPKHLTQKIEASLQRGVPKAQAKESQISIQSHWVQLHSEIAGLALKPQSQRVWSAGHPLVSICIPHRDRPEMLEDCLRSLRDQTYSNFEILIGDDGSQKESSRAFLNSIPSKVGTSPVRLFFYETSRGPGFVRNRLSEQANGEFLLFMDDDNLATPNEVESLVSAALKSEADVVTCGLDCGEWDPLSGEFRVKSRWLPLGPALSLGFFQNVYGDINSLIRKTVFLTLNGFNESPGLFGEDWEFFSRVCLRGFRLEVLPEALVKYRKHNNQYSARTERPLSREILRQSYATWAPLEIRGDLYRILDSAQKLATSPQPVFELPRSEILQPGLDLLTIRRAFKQNLFHLSQVELSKLRNIVDLEISTEPCCLILESLSHDPSFVLSELDLTGAKGILIEVHLTSSVSSEFQVYYMTREHRYYCEAQMRSVRIRPGENFLAIKIERIDLFGPIRIDPSQAPGPLVLRELSIFGGEPIPRARPIEAELGQQGV